LILSVTIIVIGTVGVHASSIPAARPGQLKWPAKTIKIAISDSLLNKSTGIKRGSDTRAALERSLRSWEAASTIRFELVESSKQNVSPSGVTGDGVSLITIAGSSENVLFIGNEDLGIPAATRIFYDKRGQITEGDIVLNPSESFSSDGTFGTFDLESIFLHEIGHLIGLGHSDLPGATMFESVPRNGVFALASVGRRSLSDADHTSIRELYGFESEGEECCGSVSGRIALGVGREGKPADVWLENLDGLVVAKTRTDDAGRFRIGGLRSGSFLIYTSSLRTSEAKDVVSSDGIEIKAGSAVKFSDRAKSTPQLPNTVLLGYNGQLSNVSVQVKSGQKHRIYFGSRETTLKDVETESTSPFISFDNRSLFEHKDYDGVHVYSVEIDIADSAPSGEYTLALRLPELGIVYLPGSISVTTVDTTEFIGGPMPSPRQ
jgi:hypothetical protein